LFPAAVLFRRLFIRRPILLRSALRRCRCRSPSPSVAASHTRLQQAARHAKDILLSHPLVRRKNEQPSIFALPHHQADCQ
jgi:hypothetical protein